MLLVMAIGSLDDLQGAVQALKNVAYREASIQCRHASFAVGHRVEAQRLEHGEDAVAGVGKELCSNFPCGRAASRDV